MCRSVKLSTGGFIMSTNTVERSVEACALDAATLCEAFQISAATHPERVAVRTSGDAVVLTWAQYAEQVRRTAAGLVALGVRRGDVVALMLTNRPEFLWVDAAAMHLGATTLGVYTTFAQEQVDYVLRDAGAVVAVTEKAFVSTLLQARKGCPRLVHLVSVDGGQGMLSLEDVDTAGDPGFDLSASWPTVDQHDVVSLVYTSGTTGPPKGVQLTHAGVIANARALHEAIPAYRAGFSAVCYLPLAHIAARVLEHYFGLLLGGTLTCCPDLNDLGATLVETRPSWLFGPPRMWEKLQASVTAAVTVESGDQLQEAIETGLRLVRAQQAGEQPSAALVADYARADALVLSGLRARLGLDRIETAAVGAAPVPSEVIEFFWALGVPLCELYGMSEVLISTVNPIDRVKIGTVGVPVTGVEVRVAEDGEVLMRGPSVMLGYLNQPEKTAATIDAHGWLHSGDIGELDGDGYLRITDRKKEMIINIGGHNMSPANIEARLKTSSPLIGQAVCIGDTRPFNVALLVLDPDAARAFAVQHGLDGCSVSALTRQRCVLDEVAAGVARANTQLSLPEQIQRWTLLNSEWLPGGVELTPTMKLQRRPIATKYENEIRALYQ
ncbi:MAG: AMP-dependent synthetase and ligase [Pseudonocardiales bacterium]|nr:AMP-dependent synthetase and ligase [Pseudonocardiales bacterium]